jgi:hypothetical protein
MVWFCLPSKNLRLSIPKECDSFSRDSVYRMYFIVCILVSREKQQGKKVLHFSRKMEKNIYINIFLSPALSFVCLVVRVSCRLYVLSFVCLVVRVSCRSCVLSFVCLVVRVSSDSSRNAFCPNYLYIIVSTSCLVIICLSVRYDIISHILSSAIGVLSLRIQIDSFISVI